ncbi:MAG: nucleotidyl transferase AbiEii/AbiGii toxin family protein [Acidobacteriota bacterium]
MKEVALQTARQSKGNERQVLREYLQNYLLFLMQKTKLDDSLLFVGGTALRFLYRIRRYSEDLDFTAKPGWDDTQEKLFPHTLERELMRAGYDSTTTLKATKTVKRIKVGFTGLLYELGLSGRKEEKTSIHIEIDSNPPSGWNEERTIVNLHLPVLIKHYDLSSAFAGKLAAVLLRPYTKGRDIYDLFWFRSKWPGLTPNLTLLSNAITQQNSGFEPIQEDNWLSTVRAKVESLDWISVIDDIAPFLEDQDDFIVFTRDAVLSLLT